MDHVVLQHFFFLQSLIPLYLYSENFQMGYVIDLETRNAGCSSELPVNSKMMYKQTVKYCDMFAMGKCLIPLLRLIQI